MGGIRCFWISFVLVPMTTSVVTDPVDNGNKSATNLEFVGQKMENTSIRTRSAFPGDVIITGDVGKQVIYNFGNQGGIGNGTPPWLCDPDMAGSGTPPYIHGPIIPGEIQNDPPNPDPGHGIPPYDPQNPDPGHGKPPYIKNKTDQGEEGIPPYDPQNLDPGHGKPPYDPQNPDPGHGDPPYDPHKPDSGSGRPPILNDPTNPEGGTPPYDPQNPDNPRIVSPPYDPRNPDNSGHGPNPWIGKNKNPNCTGSCKNGDIINTGHIDGQLIVNIDNQITPQFNLHFLPYDYLNPENISVKMNSADITHRYNVPVKFLHHESKPDTLPSKYDESDSSEVSTETPEESTEDAEVSTETPEGSTETPEESTEDAEVSTETPEGSTETPEESTEDAEVSTETPEGSTETPEESTEDAEVSTETPEGSTETPEESTEAEEVSTETPEESTETSEVSTETPEGSTEIPFEYPQRRLYIMKVPPKKDKHPHKNRYTLKKTPEDKSTENPLMRRRLNKLSIPHNGNKTYINRMRAKLAKVRKTSLVNEIPPKLNITGHSKKYLKKPL